ncbi:hypothetical protein K1T71_009649 [Dendrolimus kikuchii]|uniref:Uncharacterized protein n=1 Tax=Dendrolimus kikuchii TaxID=765133 RepID=A0ACC1CSB9_9NEOP|nr:hypothetical protein K1T71_009649 [Dendrolimus kikuchii]
MPQRASSSSSLMRPFVVLALPGMYLLYKYNQYRQQQMETARRRVTERELMHLNTKIFLNSTKCFWSNLFCASRILYHKPELNLLRCYAKNSDDECRRALADIPPEVDPLCPEPCEGRKKKKGILHKIKLKVIEGGTNFGTPFRRLECKKEVCKKKTIPEPVALPAPKRKVLPVPPPRPGVQVSILGADTAIGQYIALLLKQCPCIKKLRLYEAKDSQRSDCNRKLCSVAQDLQNINTNCLVQAFSSASSELERCLQNTDIVLMLESGYLNVDMSFEKRFCYQAPIVKSYADCISSACPKAFVIVCATPIDCMVPLVAETLKETGWYDPRKLLGSLAVPEMRASTLAARALCLEPRYTRVPCVGGTEGDSLVPLFSKAVEYFDFAKHNALMMTDAVRAAPVAVARSDGACMRAADLSEAHALAGLVLNVAHALLWTQLFLGIDMQLNREGICQKFDLPGKMSHVELELMDIALDYVTYNVDLAIKWHKALIDSECERCQMYMKKDWHYPKHFHHLDDCAIQLT